jgi:uncharacterized protein YbjT (DUF2867 family)
MTTILVTGATGTVGAHVVRELAVRPVTVRALVRDRNAAVARLHGVELVEGDLDDAGSIRRAMAGVDRVFLTAPDGPDKVAREGAVIDVAASRGIDRVVKLSALHADPASALPAFAWHGQVEELLHRADVPAVVLQPSFFMTNLLMVAAGVAHTDTLYAPTGGAAVAMVDPRDVAAVAVAALTDARHVGRTLQVTGPGSITFHDVATALTGATGRSIEYVDLTAAQARPRFEGAGLPEWLQRHLAGVFDLIRAGAFARATQVVPETTGRPATGIETFVHDHVGAFSPSSDQHAAGAS